MNKFRCDSKHTTIALHLLPRNSIKWPQNTRGFLIPKPIVIKDTNHHHHTSINHSYIALHLSLRTSNYHRTRRILAPKTESASKPQITITTTAAPLAIQKSEKGGPLSFERRNETRKGIDRNSQTAPARAWRRPRRPHSPRRSRGPRTPHPRRSRSRRRYTPRRCSSSSTPRRRAARLRRSPSRGDPPSRSGGGWGKREEGMDESAAPRSRETAREAKRGRAVVGFLLFWKAKEAVVKWTSVGKWKRGDVIHACVWAAYFFLGCDFRVICIVARERFFFLGKMYTYFQTFFVPVVHVLCLKGYKKQEHCFYEQSQKRKWCEELLCRVSWSYGLLYTDMSGPSHFSRLTQPIFLVEYILFWNYPIIPNLTTKHLWKWTRPKQT